MCREFMHMRKFTTRYVATFNLSKSFMSNLFLSERFKNNQNTQYDIQNTYGAKYLLWIWRK